VAHVTTMDSTTGRAPPPQEAPASRHHAVSAPPVAAARARVGETSLSAAAQQHATASAPSAPLAPPVASPMPPNQSPCTPRYDDGARSVLWSGRRTGVKRMAPFTCCGAGPGGVKRKRVGRVKSAPSGSHHEARRRRRGSTETTAAMATATTTTITTTTTAMSSGLARLKWHQMPLLYHECVECCGLVMLLVTALVHRVPCLRMPCSGTTRLLCCLAHC